MKPLPPVTRIAAHARSSSLASRRAISIQTPCWCERRRRVDQLLHAIAFGKAGRGRAAVFDGVEKAPAEPRHRRDAAVGILRIDRIADRCARAPMPAAWRKAIRNRACSRRPGWPAPACRPRRKIRCGGRCRDRTRNSSTGCTSGPAGKLSAIATRGLQIGVVRQAGDTRRQSGDRPAEPFEIMETMADEIAQHAAAFVAAGLPVAHAHLDGAALDVPMDGDMAQRADRTASSIVLARCQLMIWWKLKSIMVGWRPSVAWRSMARALARSLAIGFSANTGLPSSSARMRDLRLQAGSVAMATACTSGSSTSARQSPYPLATPAARASSAVRAASRRQAPRPCSVGRRGMPAAARRGHNCSRQFPDGSRV